MDMNRPLIKIADLRGLVSDIEKLNPDMIVHPEMTIDDLMEIHSLMLRGYFRELTHESP